MGLLDYLGRNWKSNAGIPIVNVPACRVLPDNMTGTLLYLAAPPGRSPVSGDGQCGVLEPGKSAVLMGLSAWFRTAPKREAPSGARFGS